MKWLLALFLLTACESDVKKLQRLETDKLIACLNAQADHQTADTASKNADSLRMQAIKADAECELATRKYEAVGR